MIESQESFRAVILDRAPAERDLGRLGGEGWRWLVYRRLVRNRLYETIEHCFGCLFERIGQERSGALVDRFLAERASRSPYLRDVPGEFLEWLERAGKGDLPAYGLDLARFEWAELSAAYTEDEARSILDFAMELPAALSPAHRLLWLKHPVHRDGELGEETPVVLCVYRDPRSFEVHTLELSPITGALLREFARAERPVVDVVRDVAREYGAIVDSAFVEALSAVIADLIERGVIVGSLARA